MIFLRDGAARRRFLSAGLLAIAGLVPRGAAAYPVAATLTADADNSSMTVTVAVPSLGLSDDDTQDLTGTIGAVFDFGASGTFPNMTDVTVTAAALEPEASFNLTLGAPPIFGVNVTISDAVADVTTPNPPATMTQTMDPGEVYAFDASSFLITIDEGMVVATGAVNDTIDLSEEPVTGFPDPGELMGTLIFTPQSSTGPYTLVNAELMLPINLSDTIAAGDPPTNVDVSVSGTLHASGSFYVALGGVPGDFDEDGNVNAADLPLWKAGFGMTGAGVGDGDADGDDDVDGDDFLVWQRNLGLAPPIIPAAAAAAAVPESGAASGLLVGLAAVGGHYRRRWRRRR